MTDPGDALRTALSERIQRVEARIAAACQRAERPRSSVCLIAVTKRSSLKVVRLLPELGVHNLGENRPQALWARAGAGIAGARWHLIGPLQRNKVDKTLPVVDLIHSVDSEKLLVALDEEAIRQGRSVDALIQVNASGEDSKQGIYPEEVVDLFPRIGQLKAVRIRGLMTLAAPEADPERCRPTFAVLRSLRDRLARELPAPHTLTELSMGMSNDFEIAIEEGATMVRLGTVLFEGLPGPNA
jgi:pyridoxal phosphate enzyme (YggS family)